MLVVAGSDSLERLGETGEETIQERHRHEIGKKAVMGSSDSLQRRRRSIIRDTGDLSTVLQTTGKNIGGGCGGGGAYGTFSAAAGRQQRH